MKKITCDICGREISFKIYSPPKYPVGGFTSDSGFFQGNESTDYDFCSDCYTRIAKAQEEEIKKIKNQS